MVPATPRSVRSPGEPAPAQYATEDNLRARQRLWEISRAEPQLDFYGWVLGLAELHGGERVLEVGCGNGPYLERVEAIGMDLSPGMLAAARRRTSGPLACGDAQRIPFADMSFDVVLAPHMLYHVPDRSAAARELRRVLRPGGVLVAATNGATNHRQMTALVMDVVGNGWRWNRPSDSVFSMENGGPQLASAFDVVEPRYAPARTVSVTDADAFAAYLESVGDHYEGEVSAWTTWDNVVAECRRRVASIIDRDGAFEIATSTGAFVCR